MAKACTGPKPRVPHETHRLEDYVLGRGKLPALEPVEESSQPELEIDLDQGWTTSDDGLECESIEDEHSGSDTTSYPNDMKWIFEDIEEVNHLERYQSSVLDQGANLRVRLTINLKAESSEREIEHMQAMGLDVDRLQTIDVQMNRSIFGIEVSSINFGTVRSLADELRPSRFSFCLNERLRKWIRQTGWPQPKFRSQPVAHVVRVMETCGVNYLWAHLVLEASKNIEEAILFLTRKCVNLKLLDALLPRTINSKVKDSSRIRKTQLKKFQKATRSNNPTACRLAITFCGCMNQARLLMKNGSWTREIIDILSTRELTRLADYSSSEGLMLSQNSVLEFLLAADGELLNLNQSCLMCNGPLCIELIRPSLCQSTLCEMQFEQIGLGFSLEDEVVKNPTIVELLIDLTWCASQHGRLHLCFPPCIRDINGNELRADSKTDLNRVSKLLDQCPSVQSMIEFAHEKTLLSRLRSINPLLLSLLRWIVASNRSYIRLLQPDERFPSISTERQFVLLTSTPKKEAAFQERLQRATKSRGVEAALKYAFHGSPAGNWHAIVRQGLRVMSGTKDMLHGAAFGDGIYMAPRVSTSRVYSTGGFNWHRTCVFYLALCEIANTNDLKPAKPHYVVKDPTLITTRYLFVYSSSRFLAQKDVKASSIIMSREDQC